MAQASTHSYDDLPEADVATVLEVPLLWGPSGSSSARPAASHRPRTHRGAHAAQRRVGGAVQVSGRHRAEPSVRLARRTTTHWTPTWRRQPWAHTIEVGLVSALLVLGVIGAVLLALALWLP